MRFLKKILSFVAGCVLIWKVSAVGFVSAEEAPHDVKLTCETKYIDIDEIPEDRVVELNLSIDNNPGFHALCVVIDVDPRLSYDSYNIARMVSIDDDVRCVNYTVYPESDHQIRFDIFSGNYSKVIRDGTLLTVFFKLPASELTQIGDIFKVNIIDEFKIPIEEEVYFDTSILLENPGKIYGPDSFSKLNGGGIHITGDQPLQVTEPTSKQVPENNEKQSEENNTEQPNEHENNIGVKPEVSNEITSVTSPVTTPIITTAPKTTLLSTTPSTYAVTTATIETSELVTVGIAEKSNDKEKEENKKEIDKTLLIVATMTALAVSGVIFIIIRRSKTDKHEK